MRRMTLVGEEDTSGLQAELEIEQQRQQPASVSRHTVAGRLWSWITSSVPHAEDEERGAGVTSFGNQEQNLRQSDEIIRPRRRSRIGR